MFYQVIPTPRFLEVVDYYKRKKRYFKIDDDISRIVVNLENGNLLGDEITDLRLPNYERTYKVRVANTSANVGKSNGFRLIYYVIKNDTEIYLLTIYSKKDKENITSKEILDIINTYCT
ncbi:MAG: hypothetical protein WA131_07610 [Desulfitobacteriaceae bacterium]